MKSVCYKYNVRSEATVVAGAICTGMTFFALSMSGFGAEPAFALGSVSAGGAHGLGASVVLEGMFGDPMDGASAGTNNSMLGGEAGRLVEPMSLVAQSSESAIPEATTCRLTVSSLNDDGSVTDMESGWVIVNGPFVAIDSEGVALAGAVYTNTSAVLAAVSGGLTGKVNVLVLDTLKDNFGLYAADGIVDTWQVTYFGVNNANGQAGADYDHDGQNNYSEFSAGTSPLNKTDVFGVKSMRRNAAGQVELVLAPAFSNRTYHVETSTDLQAGDWVRLASTNGSAQQTQLVMATMAATNEMMFYRASIDYAW